MSLLEPFYVAKPTDLQHGLIDSYYVMLISFQLVINLDDYSLNQVDTSIKIKKHRMAMQV